MELVFTQVAGEDIAQALKIKGLIYMDKDIKKNLPDLFTEYALQFPHHLAVIAGEEKMTYGELNQKVNRLANYLQNQGIQAEASVALCLPRSLDFLVALMAILKAGGAYLPLDSSQPKERLHFLLEDSKAAFLITQSTHQQLFEGYTGAFVLLDNQSEIIQQQSSDNPSSSLAKDTNLAYIIYTSGSTGMPKGVLIERHAVREYCLWFAAYTRCKPQERIDFSSNPIFDMAVSVSLAPLILGLTVVICPDEIKKNVRHYLHHLAESSINLIKLTPSYFKILLQEVKNHRIDLPHLRTIVLGGENLAAATCQSWLKYYPQHRLFNEYGPTETTVAVFAYEVETQQLSSLGASIPIGAPAPKISYKIVNERDEIGALGHEGELLIGGACVARGYLNRPELTAQRFVQDPSDDEGMRWYRTGDLCRQRPDGLLEYLGRMDDQVKIRGFRIEPGEIEKCLAAYTPLKAVAVVTQKDTLEEHRLIAYYVHKDPGATLSTHSLRKFLSNKLPEYMIPSAFIKVEFLPLNANGKLDKSALPQPQLQASQYYLEPSTPLEKKLVSFWAEELGIKLIGLNDNFFELGGHSLAAARLVSKINHELKKSITLNEFYQAACIAELIPIIKKTRRTKNPHKPFKKYKNVATFPLNDFQFVLWMADTFEPKAKKLNIVARKRFQGQLDTALLKLAMESLLKKHEVFQYRVLKLRPEQRIQKNNSLPLFVENISLISEKEMEQELENSLIQLTRFHRWDKNAPLLMIRLFHLKEGSEVQICMPHLITDDASVDILFEDLSYFYLCHSQEHSLGKIETDTHFKRYIFTEYDQLESTLNERIAFWENYLQDASFFSFPEQYIVHDMKKAGIPYSSHAKIPKAALTHLRIYCEQNHMSINNGLCALLMMALHRCCGNTGNNMPYTTLNIIKSTKEDPIYDHSIGCFLRVEPVKAALHENISLEELGRQIHQSIVETSNYQQCPNMVKLSAVSTLHQDKKPLTSFFVKIMTNFAVKILKFPQFYRKVIQHSLLPLIFFKRKNHFIINLNVRNNFISEEMKKSHLFGLKAKPIKNRPEDLLAIDYVFEACFFYNENQKSHALAISANLRPEFRERLAKELITMMGKLPLEINQTKNTLEYQVVS